MSDEAKGAAGIDPMVVARLGAQKSKFRAAAKVLTTERDGLRAELSRLTAENTELKAKADGSASSKRVAELEQQIRDRDHRAAFDGVAKGKGVAEDALGLLYQASGYRASGEVDEAAIAALLDEQKGKPGVARLFGEATATPTPTPSGTGTGIVKPAVGSGQADRNGTPPAALFAADDPRLSDARYVMLNYDKITQAAQERVARGEI